MGTLLPLFPLGTVLYPGIALAERGGATVVVHDLPDEPVLLSYVVAAGTDTRLRTRCRFPSRHHAGPKPPFRDHTGLAARRRRVVTLVVRGR